MNVYVTFWESFAHGLTTQVQLQTGLVTDWKTFCSCACRQDFLSADTILHARSGNRASLESPARRHIKFFLMQVSYARMGLMSTFISLASDVLVCIGRLELAAADFNLSRRLLSSSWIRKSPVVWITHQACVRHISRRLCRIVVGPCRPLRVWIAYRLEVLSLNRLCSAMVISYKVQEISSFPLICTALQLAVFRSLCVDVSGCLNACRSGWRFRITGFMDFVHRPEF
jgi:hypothetical protein